MAQAQVSDDSFVAVPRHLLKEVIADGCCPLHLRLQLLRALELGTSSSSTNRCTVELLDLGSCGAQQPVPILNLPPVDVVAAASVVGPWHSDEIGEGPLADLDRQCLATVTAFLAYPDVLAVRCCSREPLQWAMMRGALREDGPRHWVHDRIRTRLWMRRIADVTRGTKDESVFETRMRSLADEALRSRMETEMQEALAHMEEQIRAFQAEVDRRLEEQERHVRRLVEERVQQELDSILASEVVKVQAMVEQRVRERVSAVFQREVRETVRELQTRLDALLDENEVLRDAFAEANFRSKCLFWAMWPPALRLTAMTTSVGLGPECGGLAPGLGRRLRLACCWSEVDFRTALSGGSANRGAGVGAAVASTGSPAAAAASAGAAVASARGGAT